MQTSRRPNRLAGFGLVDALVGLFLLAVTAALLYSGFSTLIQLEQRQETKVEALARSLDAKAYNEWF